MSTCHKDLHSVYIDNEMPESYVAEYESIVSSDESAKKAQDAVRSLHDALRSDAAEKSVDDLFMEQSFARLQSKMHYSKVIKKSSSPSFVTPFIKYTASFASAAAVFALVFTPIHIKAVKNNNTQEVNPIAITTKASAPNLAKNSVVVDGTIPKENLSSVFAPPAAESSLAKLDEPKDTLQSENEKAEAKEPLNIVEQKTVQASYLASNGGPVHGNSFRENLPSIDVFRPDFSSSSIRISVPKFHEISNNFETDKNFFEDEGQ